MKEFFNFLGRLIEFLFLLFLSLFLIVYIAMENFFVLACIILCLILGYAFWVLPIEKILKKWDNNGNQAEE